MTSTSHGLPNFVRNEGILLKILWAIATLASWGYCFYLIILAIIAFFNYETVSSSKQVNEAPTLFPAIDICNLNPYDGLKLVNEIDGIIDSDLNSSDSRKNAKYIADQYLNELLITIENNVSYFDPIESGYSLSTLLLSCRYQGKNCSENDFYRYHNYFYGNCYRFNGGLDSKGKKTEIRKSTKPGWRNGLQLELSIGSTESLTFSYRSGIRVLIHNQSSEAFPEEDGLSVSTGQETNIGMSKTFITKLPSPYSNCIDGLNKKTLNNDFLNLMVSEYNRTTYDQKLCQKLCMQKYIIDKCKCFDYSLPKLTKSINTSGCFFLHELECKEKSETEFYNSEAVSECYKLCPFECTRAIYSYDLSMANFPSTWFLENFFGVEENSNSFEDLLLQYQQTRLLINVFYNEMSYTNMVESPTVSSDTLLSQIGGFLGLFIGISVLSCFENVELVILLIFHYFHSKNKKNSKS